MDIYQKGSVATPLHVLVSGHLMQIRTHRALRARIRGTPLTVQAPSSWIMPGAHPQEISGALLQSNAWCTSPGTSLALSPWAVRVGYSPRKSLALAAGLHVEAISEEISGA